MKIKTTLASVISLTLLALVPFLCRAQEKMYVPDQLKPWVSWVKEEIADFQCAAVKESKQCVWPGQIILDLSDNVLRAILFC